MGGAHFLCLPQSSGPSDIILSELHGKSHTYLPSRVILLPASVKRLFTFCVLCLLDCLFKRFLNFIVFFFCVCVYMHATELV